MQTYLHCINAVSASFHTITVASALCAVECTSICARWANARLCPSHTFRSNIELAFLRLLLLPVILLLVPSNVLITVPTVI